MAGFALTLEVFLQEQIASDLAGSLRSTLSGDQKQHVSNQGTQNELTITPTKSCIS